MRPRKPLWAGGELEGGTDVCVCWGGGGFILRGGMTDRICTTGPGPGGVRRTCSALRRTRLSVSEAHTRRAPPASATRSASEASLDLLPPPRAAGWPAREPAPQPR